MAGYISTGQYLWGLRRVLDGMTCGGAASSHGASGKAADVELASDCARPVQAG
ncbi:MAG: hypothetical protein JWQ45_3137 [Blastococcus sp.]|jgi:hypothetical protein|nr:hypothetical protein [Blastococcus sp.]